jgi:hypothetical protein
MRKILLILAILIVCCLTAYFKLDEKLYYFGKSNFDIYQKLPLNIKPVFKNDYPSEFRLEDDSGFSIASRGEHQYIGSDVEINIKKIIAYTFTHQKLNILIEDFQGKKHFLECLKNTDHRSKQDIKTTILDPNIKVNLDSNKWIEIDDDYFRKIERTRNYLLLFSFLLLIFWVFVAKRSLGRNNHDEIY